MNPVKPLYVPAPFQDSAEQGRLILRDGSMATVRPLKPEDRDELRAFFERLSPESRRRRFFSLALPSAELIQSLCDTDDSGQCLTLIVKREVGGASRIIAAGSYQAVKQPNTAEAAFAVEDAFQGRGLGTLLLERLAVLAARHGIRRFWAVTHADNQAMVDVFRESGFQMTERFDGGYTEVDLTVMPSEESVSRSELRDRVATTASLRPFFQPNAVAVIGASRDPASIGYRILNALVENRFRGALYPVNPKATMLAGLTVYPSMDAIPGPVDLAVITVPRDLVLNVVDECGRKGVHALVIISVGFAEVNAAGRELQTRVVEKARGHGMRIIGPNCLGILNTDPAVNLNASFSPVYPPAGKVAMSSQSGALGLAILAAARRMNLGLSTFVSIGNKADVSGNDLLQYWEEDPGTEVILLYLESFGNPRRFARIARRVSRGKPIVCVKAGRTSAGSRAAGSHTAALAASDVAVEALFRQTGVIRAETLEEMFDLAALLGSQPLPAGRRVGIVTNAGGPAILCTDACEAGGLVVPELSAATRAELGTFLPAAASLGNPVDMIASAPPEHYQRTIATVLASPEVDALIVIYIPVGLADTKTIGRAVLEGVSQARAAGAAQKPVLACLMAEEGIRTQLTREKERIPSYAFPEAAANVLTKAVRYAEDRVQPLGMIPDFEDVDWPKARQVVQAAVEARGAGWLTAQETRDVLVAAGLPVAAGDVATTADEAVRVAAALGYPVVLKLASHTLVHKTELDAIKLNLKDATAVRQAFGEIRDRLAGLGKLEAMDGVLVQPMLSGGVEVMIGVADDPLFGPLLAFGLGGIYVEVLKDVVFRVTPLTDRDAREMVKSIRGQKLLAGYRGHPPADTEKLQEVLLRISRLVDEVTAIRELDLNPIFAMPPGEGCRLVDARIRVA